MNPTNQTKFLYFNTIQLSVERESGGTASSEKEISRVWIDCEVVVHG